MANFKDFFTAGLEMEAAREVELAAAEALRVAAAKACPEALSEYDGARDVLRANTKKYHELSKSLGKELRENTHEMMHKLGIDCGDPQCAIAGEGAH